MSRSAVKQRAERDLKAAQAAEGEAQGGLFAPVGGSVVAYPGRQKQIGRPRGARNRKDADLVRYIERRHGNALVRLAELYSRDTLQLASYLRCPPQDAMALQLRAAEIVAPYLAAKRPAQLEVTGDVPHLALFLGGLGGAGEAGLTVDGEAIRLDGKSIEHQSLSDGGDGDV